MFCFSALRFTEQFVGRNIQAVTGKILSDKRSRCSNLFFMDFMKIVSLLESKAIKNLKNAGVNIYTEFAKW